MTRGFRCLVRAMGAAIVANVSSSGPSSRSGRSTSAPVTASPR
jgi:hypothetical protein